MSLVRVIGAHRRAPSVFLLALLFLGCQRHPKQAFPTPYQAVLLDNGQVLFGRLDEVDAPFRQLNDVFYVQTRVDPTTKEVSNILIRRGQEWHKPDRMFINTGHILAIETVAPDSKVADLIARASAPTR